MAPKLPAMQSTMGDLGALRGSGTQGRPEYLSVSRATSQGPLGGTIPDRAECPGTLSVRVTLPLPLGGRSLEVPVFRERIEPTQVRV